MKIQGEEESMERVKETEMVRKRMIPSLLPPWDEEVGVGISM